MIETTADAEAWVKKQGCSSHRAETFVMEVKLAIESDVCNWTDYDKIQDYIDSLRRAPYVGLGI